MQIEVPFLRHLVALCNDTHKCLAVKISAFLWFWFLMEIFLTGKIPVRQERAFSCQVGYEVLPS